MDTERHIDEIYRQQLRQDALYHRFAASCGLSDTAMWLLYTLWAEPEGCTQQQLCRRCSFPKQTVGSAVTALSRSGVVALHPLPGTHGGKRVVLTDEGRQLAERTAARLRQAELAAYGQLDDGTLAAYAAATARISDLLEKEIGAACAEHEREMGKKR